MISSSASCRRSLSLARVLVVAAAATILGLKAAHLAPESANAVPEAPSTGALAAATPRLGEAAGGPAQGTADLEFYPSIPMQQVEWALRHNRAAVILFHSTLCRPCRMMDALVQLVRRDYEPDVLFIDVIIDQPANEEVIRWAKMGSIPAFYFLTASGEGKRIVGPMTQAELREQLATLQADAQRAEALQALGP